MHALILGEPYAVEGERTPHFPVKLATIPTPVAQPGQLLVKLIAGSLNRREDWIRKGLYPGIKANSILGSDGVGVVEAPGHPRHGERVIINPGVGWVADKRAPEQPLSILGLLPNAGTFAEYIAVPEEELFPAPAHLSDEEASAVPVAYLTAYRAVVTKGQVGAGDRVLITGIGGGVALAAFRICQALGAECYVTSSSPTKIERAVSLGAKAGVNYRDADYPQQLKETLQGGLLDAVIDGAGGDMSGLMRVLTPGARIVCYGGTETGKFAINMVGVLKNIDLCGSTLGSRQEFADLLAMMEQHRVPVDVDRVIDGLENGIQAIDALLDPQGFGKIVLRI